MNKQTLTRFLPVLVMIVFLCVVPLIFSEYPLSVITLVLINLILVVSYRFIINMGEWSFAHISLMGVGGYTAGLLITRLGWPFWGALPIAVLASAVVGLIISVPCLRTRGFYFFLATFAAGQAIWWVWVLFPEPFGSYAGIRLIPRPEPILGVSFTSGTNYYYLVLGLTLLSLIILYRFEKSRVGTTISAMRSGEQLSEAMGINSNRYRTLVFVTASAFAGLAGVLLSVYTGIATPKDFSLTYAIDVLIFVIVGGAASFSGPIAGTAVLTTIGEALRGYEEYVPLVYGTILILVALFQPGGLVALPKRILSLRKGKAER